MGHVQDRWTKPGPSGRRVRSARYGHGKRWQAVWIDPDGRERSRACATKDEAQALLSRVNVDMASGTYVSLDAGRETFTQYAERWRTQQLHHRPATAIQAESRLRNHVYPRIGHLPLAGIRRSDIQALVTVVAKTLAPATVEVTYAYVSAVLRSAVEDRVIVASPCVRIRLPEVVGQKVVPLTWEQVDSLRAGMPAHMAAAVDLAAATGLRSAELRGVTVDKLTPALHLLPAAARLPTSAVVRVDRQLISRAPGGAPIFGPPKTPASDRSVRVGASTVAVLVEHLRQFGPGPGGLLFASRRQAGAISRSRAGEMWRAAADTLPAALGLPGGTGWHELRHFHASLLIASGLSVRAVADRLGHEDPAETLRTYSHLWPDDEERAVAAFEDALAVQGRTSDGPALHRRRSAGVGP